MKGGKTKNPTAEFEQVQSSASPLGDAVMEERRSNQEEIEKLDSAGEDFGEEEEELQGENGDTEAEKEAEGERPKLADGYYEIEAVRRKRVRKGQVQYLIKWRGWSEAENTWEPVDNLLQVYDVIEAFEESLKSGKSWWTRKRKRKSGITHVQTKKKQQLQHPRSPASATYNLPSHVVRIIEDPLPLNRLNDMTRTKQNGETNVNGVNIVETSKKVNENGVRMVSSKREEQKEQNELDLKLCELRGAMSVTMEDADRIAMDSQEAHLTGADPLANGLPKTDGAGPVQLGRCTGAKKRKSGFVKRFMKDPASCSLDDVIAPSDALVPVGVQYPDTLVSNTNCKNKHDDADSMCTITQIIKPISYRASISNNVKEVLLAFEAVRLSRSVRFIFLLFVATPMNFVAAGQMEPELQWITNF